MAHRDNMSSRIEFNLDIVDIDGACQGKLCALLDDYFAQYTSGDDEGPWIGTVQEAHALHVNVAGVQRLPSDLWAFKRELFDRIATVTSASCRLELWYVLREPDLVFTNDPSDEGRPTL